MLLQKSSSAPLRAPPHLPVQTHLNIVEEGKGGQCGIGGIIQRPAWGTCGPCNASTTSGLPTMLPSVHIAACSIPPTQPGPRPIHIPPFSPDSSILYIFANTVRERAHATNSNRSQVAASHACNAGMQAPGQDDILDVLHAVRLMDFGQHCSICNWDHLPTPSTASMC